MANNSVAMHVQVKCPACPATIDVPFTITGHHWEDGRQFLDFQPDMADLWAHAWTHDTEADRG